MGGFVGNRYGVPMQPGCRPVVVVRLGEREQICNRHYPPEVAFHPARLARLVAGTPPPLVLFEVGR